MGTRGSALVRRGSCQSLAVRTRAAPSPPQKSAEMGNIRRVRCPNKSLFGLKVGRRATRATSVFELVANGRRQVETGELHLGTALTNEPPITSSVRSSPQSGEQKNARDKCTDEDDTQARTLTAPKKIPRTIFFIDVLRLQRRSPSQIIQAHPLRDFSHVRCP